MSITGRGMAPEPRSAHPWQMASPTTFLQWMLVAGSAALWISGLRLFLTSGLTSTRKVTWSAALVAIGMMIGFILPTDAILRRFLLLLLALPLLAAFDLLVLRSQRTFAFWVRACGFEVCTVFAAATISRYFFDAAGVVPFATNR